MSIDLRFLVISITIHSLLIYSLNFIEGVTFTETTPQLIEVVFDKNNNSKNKLIHNPILSPKIIEETNEPTLTFAEEERKFKKQQISKNLGIPLNIPQNPNIGSEDMSENKNGNKVQFMSSSHISNFGIKEINSQNLRSPKTDRSSSASFDLPNIKTGEMTFLNSNFSTYASFFNRVAPKVIFAWQSNINDLSEFPHLVEKFLRRPLWRTEVLIVLDSEGHIKDIIIERDSGSVELDSVVLDSLRTAGPFLNPPTGMIEPDGFVRIRARFALITQKPIQRIPQHQRSVF